MTELRERQDSAGAALYSPTAIRGLARARLLRQPPPADGDGALPPDRGDHDLNGGHPETLFQAGPIRRAAVLVPLIARPEGASVLLTRRSEHLPTHPGQIAFPGGKIEATDAGPMQAALREAEEEIGLPDASAEPLGYLDLYQTGTGFRIVPVVALVEPDFTPRLDPGEVAAVFEVPLVFLMTPANHQRQSRRFRGLERRFYAMPFGEHYIWGATAGIIRNLYDRMYG